MKIGIIAPANSITKKEDISLFKKGVKLLELNGFNVIVGKNVFSDKEGICGTIEEKLEDIYNIAAQTKYLICATGGVNSNNLLNKIDFEKIKNNVFIGNSNPVLLFNAFYKVNKQISYIGPNVKSLGKAKTNFSFECLKDIVNNKKTIRTEEKNIIINKGTGEGIAYGGNVQSLRRILGTKYFPINKKMILYIEADPSETNHIEFESIIEQFTQAGILKKCTGIIIGKYDDNDFIKRIFNDYKIPIIICNNLGHNVNNNLLPIGKKIRINEDGTIEVI